MNLDEQIGVLEVGVDQLIHTATRSNEALSAESQPAAHAATNAADAPARIFDAPPPLEPVFASAAHAAPAQAVEHVEPPELAEASEKAQLTVGRPSQNEITMTIGGKTVSLNPLEVGQLIEELSNARASMEPQPPMGIPAGWRFASTRNPVMAVQKQSNGERLLMLRHTGHGWVPFSFSPDMVIQLYMLLTQR